MDMEADGHSGTDYSDFQIQTINANVFANSNPSSGGSTKVRAHNRVEPLEDRGGLDQNEEAELVYWKLHASLEFEDEAGDQDVGTAAEYRGQFGANFAAQEEEFVDVNAAGGIGGDDTTISEENTGNGGTNSETKTDNSIFGHWRAVGGLPFDDETNGPGGSANSNVYQEDRRYRELMGRGPVLDSDDDVTILHTMNAGDTVTDFAGVVKILCVWDIAETDESGAEFSPTA